MMRMSWSERGSKFERWILPRVVWLLVKAFDTVNRRLLWARLRHYGVCGSLFFALKAGYSSRKLVGKLGGVLSSPKKDDGMGVRQGEVDSSDVFALFIDDLDEEIRRAEEKAGRKLGIPLIGNDDSTRSERIAALKHVDDTALVASTAEDAQLLLDAVSKWCRKW